MAKSYLQQLRDAVAAGDLEKARDLTEKLAGTKTKTKPTKEKAKPKAAPKVKLKTKAVPRQRADLDVTDLDESSYIAPSFAPGHDPLAGRTFIGEDGKEHRFSRRVSMAGMKFVNRFNPNEYDGKLPPQVEKLDKKRGKSQRSVAARPPAKKVKMRCSNCGDIVEVYPWEAATIDGTKDFRCDKRGCVKRR